MRLRCLPARVDNYIWVLSDSRGQALVVDPGESEPVLAAANEDSFVPSAVLLTHHHDDHVAGTERLLARWPALRVYGPADARLPIPATPVADGERFSVGPWPLQALHVPGHTRSHVAFFVDALPGFAPVLFSGDTLFSLGCGRLFEGTPAQMHASLTRLAALPGATRLCCGHEYTLANAAFAAAVDPGNAALARRTQEATAMRERHMPTLPSTLASERACNPFLRCDAPAITSVASQRLGRAPDDAVETFATLRAWKDGFAA